MLSAAGLYAALPTSLSAGPRWLVPVATIALAIATIVTHRRGNHAANAILAYLAAGVLTAFLILSVVRLVTALPAHTESPVALLRSAASLWITNILVFALWYWRLDAGGPHERAKQPGHTTGAFLFPQMTLGEKKPERHHANAQQDDVQTGVDAQGRPWEPMFIDYLFLAFNTSTALSPTDVPILSRWANAT